MPRPVTYNSHCTPQLLKKYESVYRSDSANYAAGLLQLAVCLAKTKDFTEAGGLAIQALEINDEKLGEAHKTTLETLQFLKDLAKKQGDREAWEQYHNALRQRLGWEPVEA